MRAYEITTEADETPQIKLSDNGRAKALAWIEKVYAKFPATFQSNHVMIWGEGDGQELAMFELVPSLSRRGAVEVKWFQAYPLRKGIGSRAMQELQALAKEDGIALTLFPWDKGQVSQAKLMKFYRSVGFNPIAKGSKSLYWEPGSKQGVSESSDDSAEAYKANLIKSLPQIMKLFANVGKGWSPSKEQLLAAVDTGYTVMKHTSDTKQAGKAVMDELNALYRMNQGQQSVTEVFDQPYKLKWEKGAFGDYDAIAHDDGNYLNIMFNTGYTKDKEEAWSVEFFRNNSQEVTGEGDAQRVFATVLTAIGQFIKKKKPLNLFFSASKLDPTANRDPEEPRANPASRAKLYTRLVQRYAAAWGYSVNIRDEGSIVRYRLESQKSQDA